MLQRKKTSRQNAYIGKAGQLAVMAELSLLGYNVALPEIDKGDDIFVVNDHTGKLWRLQVKAATAQSRDGQYQVVIDDAQIRTAPQPNDPDLEFVFALRLENRWRFVVMSRQMLKPYIDAREGKFGSLKSDCRRTLTITVSKNKKTLGQIQCSRVSWEEHMENWKNWPRLDHEAIFAKSETTT